MQGNEFYSGWSIQILERNGHSFVDATSKYIPSSSYYKSGECTEWLVKITIEESEDGKLFLCGEYDHPDHPRSEKLFEFNNEELIRVAKKERGVINQDGLCIYSDKFFGHDYSSSLSDIDLSCTDDSYSGSNCIRWKTDIAWKQCISYSSENEFNFTKLLADNYEIEFFVKYEDEKLRLCTNLETEYSGRHYAYGYSFDLPKEFADGQWHKINVPLKEFYNCDNCDDAGWEKIKIFKMWVTSEDTVGSTFSLDEIRIRKIIQ